MKIVFNWGQGLALRLRSGQAGIKGEILKVVQALLAHAYRQAGGRHSFRPAANKGEVSVTFCSDKFMKKLNYKYRGKNKSTDVLSFDLGDKKLLGDVYISIPDARRQAKEYNVPLEEEIKRLAVHGILHVLGLSHKEMGVYGN